MTKEEWNSVYFSTMAMASVAVGALGVAIGLLALERSQTQAAGVGSLGPPGPTPLGVNIPRVHYQDGDILVEVRNPGEWHRLKGFVQPDDLYLTHAIMGALSG